MHQESIRTYDGKERPIPRQAGLTETCENLDASTQRCTEKRDGKVVLELLARLSDDGKTMYVERTRFGDQAKPVSGVVVYEKQSGS
jgi:hypothetical protein